MQKAFLFSLITLFCVKVFAQKESYDVISYTISKNWQSKEVDRGRQLAITDGKTGEYAIALLIKSSASSARAIDNFTHYWNQFVKAIVTISEEAAVQPPVSENGWDVISGGANYTDGNKTGTATLLSATGGGQMTAVVLMTNTKRYQTDLSALIHSLELAKAKQSKSIDTDPNATSASNIHSIAGTWLKSGSIHMGVAMKGLEQQWGTRVGGYTTDEYIFNPGGTYQFYSKLFSMSVDKIILIRESGNYKIEGGYITVSPDKSTVESYAKKDGADKWGKLLSSEKRPLEKVIYTFTKHYFEGIKEWNLVLQSKKQTDRDGPFSTNTTFTNAYYFSIPSINKEAILLPK